MTFPQTQPANAIRNGQEYWRLFTPLQSSGDIYESDVSALAMVLGPDSDISCVNVTYFDQTTPSRSNQAVVSNEKALIGRLDALASQQYGTGQRARILISPLEQIPQAGIYEPQGFAAPDALVIEDINIDLFQYFPREPAIISERNDRTHYFQAPTLPLASNGIWYVLPFYGRRFASVMLVNESGVSYTITTFGVTLDNGTLLGGAANQHPQVTLLGPTAVADGTTDIGTVNAETDGTFDLLVVHVTTAIPTGTPLALVALKVRTSDR